VVIVGTARFSSTFLPPSTLTCYIHVNITTQKDRSFMQH